MRLVIVHFHLRPGGIRRIIELATRHLVRQAPRPITGVVLATGQPADKRWHELFAKELPGVPVEVWVEPAFCYLSEQRGSPSRITAHIRNALNDLFAESAPGNCLVWSHNPGVGRNLILARELAAACATRGLPLVLHHHDWWFDNRWARWPEMRHFGFRTLAMAARAIFPQTSNVVHAAINHADADCLASHLKKGSFWLPNLTEPAPPPAVADVRAACGWLAGKLAHQDAPVWLLPCRTLRRKNIAEALLLTRWLRPSAWLVVTGGTSSADEIPYAQALEHAASLHHWRLRLGALAGDESCKPGIPELLAASEAVLLTSIQEGFGLPYLEAAAAQRPLIARRLSNIAPDLDRFGFRFPQAYDEILIPPGLFNWSAERVRQRRGFNEWRAGMPRSVQRLITTPQGLAARSSSPVPFSRLSLTAQLEVLSHPALESWAACTPYNPFLITWRRRAQMGKLQVSPWPRGAKNWLSGEAYARRFFAALESNSTPRRNTLSPVDLQSDFIVKKLDARNLYPLLWSRQS